MTLITTISGADTNCYVTLAEITAHFTERGWTVPDAATLEQQAIRATDYIDANYEFIGRRATRDQARQWPRYYERAVAGWHLDSTTIPAKVKQAIFELTYRLGQNDSLFDTIKHGAIVRKKSKVGPVETDLEYSQSTTMDRPKFPAVDALLAPFVTNNRSQSWGVSQVSLG